MVLLVWCVAVVLGACLSPVPCTVSGYTKLCLAHAVLADSQQCFRGGSRLGGSGFSVSRCHMSFYLQTRGDGTTRVVLLTEGLILAGC